MTAPLPLSALSDLLKVSDVTFDLARFEEGSGSGNGQQWTAELGRPLWTATLALVPRRPTEARMIDATLRALGTNKPFLLADPSYDLEGRAPGASVQIKAISPDRTQISLKGLPAGYPVLIGDRFSISHGGARYFAEFATAGTANGAGETGLLTVTPFPLLTLSAGASVELAKPVLQVFIPSGGRTSFTNQIGKISQGASLKLMQKV